MLKCNLSILLAERNLKITKISKDTGISRTTLTSLFYNNAKGIQFDTLNTLCSYLNVTPSNLLQYLPIEVIFKKIISYKQTNDDSLKFEIYATIIQKQHKTDVSFIGVLSTFGGYKSLSIGLEKSDYSKDIQKSKLILNTFWRIPYDFKSIISLDLINTLLNEKIITREDIPSLVFVWEDDLDTFIEQDTGSIGKGLSAIFGNDIDDFLNLNLKKDPE